MRSKWKVGVRNNGRSLLKSNESKTRGEQVFSSRVLYLVGLFVEVVLLLDFLKARDQLLRKIVL